ncbi:unnamed protein product [Fraxinus pennsylvanica]|uniref:RSE1/DDB1/CPSF1 first beta-propeller domain-containing protein n=1 Tax=Fraxinus pennsylvanica TaxID=56036 RepID=A0AAD1ZFR6_9LAMI|nr:unnamed protein product [Fraxinus pennsylvanica]
MVGGFFRLEELQVLDIKFLHGCPTPTIVVLYQDNKDARHVQTYEVALRDKDFIEGPWSQNNLNNGAELLIPVPPLLCGVLIIGEETIVYCSASAFKAIPIRPSITKAYGTIDANGSRYLLGDHSCLLHLLVITHEKERTFLGYQTAMCPRGMLLIQIICLSHPVELEAARTWMIVQLLMVLLQVQIKMHGRLFRKKLWFKL